MAREGIARFVHVIVGIKDRKFACTRHSSTSSDLFDNDVNIDKYLGTKVQ
jgi:hypothetical protein